MSLHDDFAAALLNPQAPLPGGLKAWNGSDPAQRFDVYRNNVTTTLVNALADTFGVVQTMVGEEFFRAMARHYVRRAAPRDPVLAWYGADFAEFVQAFEPAASLPFLADVARLEMARVQAYHAADAAPVAAQTLHHWLGQPDDLAQCRLSLHPSLRLLRSRYAVVSLWAAHQQDSVDLSGIDPALAQDALVLRSGLDVLVLPLDPGCASWVQALLQDHPLAVAAHAALHVQPDFDLGASLSLLLHHHAVTAMAP